MQLDRLPAVALLALVGTGCSAASRYDPFLIPAEELYQSVEIIVVTPVHVAAEVELHEDALASVDSLVDAALRSAEFSVIPARQYAEIWDRIVLELGGLFDPHTGERDELKFQDAREQLVGELEERFDPGALLYLEIVEVDAPFADGVARWDGTVQAVTPFGLRVLDAVGAALIDTQGFLPEGTVRALSLELIIEDMSGAELYVNFGGMQVLETIGEGIGERTPVPASELCADQQRNRKAVEIALAPLKRERPGKDR
ncbi:MAG: hypothetical protein GTN62_02905 [Gemmatimonadales bacterium]|nr:hypothetical protein [Gemmatimonadales bacterium]NIN10253.1 hypothetical protein [Gemmatimonadales bacterium]NIN49049.1 hypothetical protein [Gemmatimonadales bacterium]NIP06513.1 hypothetical protein [Gemmatimonadales bacterium]NIQ98856.1 hypothetical protein [Gemmatimonadales bacterium]